jgi:2-phosphosulfolactate phosphatase
VRVETILTPAEIAALDCADPSEDTCVVFDVLRATTSIVTALACGAARVFPVTTVAEALALSQKLPKAILAGERGGEKIKGFELGNSPSEYCHLQGMDIISTTTNGTPALEACRRARGVFAAAFLNLGATASALLARKAQTVRIVCAGTRDGFSFEDGLAAGALIERLGCDDLDDASAAMRSLFAAHRGDWQDVVRGIGNGRALVSAGRVADIEWAMRADVFPVVVRRDPEGGFFRLAPHQNPCAKRSSPLKEVV